MILLNPQLANTLQSKGSRGCVFWIRCSGGYLQKTKTWDDIGEWRAGKNCYSIIYGKHPDGNNYRFLNEVPPITVKYDEIRWPDYLESKSYIEEAEESEADGRGTGRSGASGASGSSVASDSSGSSDTSESSVSSEQEDWSSPFETEDDLIRICTPQRIHSSNSLLFKLARGILTIEKTEGCECSQTRLKAIFEKWYSASKRFLRPDQTKEDYYREFFVAKQTAKHPLGGVTLSKAFKMAKQNPVPQEALEYENPEYRLLISICRELQLINRSDPFYLSGYSGAFLVGVSDKTCANWLKALCGAKILTLVTRGTTYRAARYRYNFAPRPPIPIPPRRKPVQDLVPAIS
jgi:hypothetical protein